MAALCLYLGLQPTPLMRSIEAPIAQTVHLVQSAGGVQDMPVVEDAARTHADEATDEPAHETDHTTEGDH